MLWQAREQFAVISTWNLYCALLIKRSVHGQEQSAAFASMYFLHGQTEQNKTIRFFIKEVKVTSQKGRAIRIHHS